MAPSHNSDIIENNNSIDTACEKALQLNNIKCLKDESGRLICCQEKVVNY